MEEPIAKLVEATLLKIASPGSPLELLAGLSLLSLIVAIATGSNILVHVVKELWSKRIHDRREFRNALRPLAAHVDNLLTRLNDILVDDRGHQHDPYLDAKYPFNQTFDLGSKIDTSVFRLIKLLYEVKCFEQKTEGLQSRKFKYTRYIFADKLPIIMGANVYELGATVGISKTTSDRVVYRLLEISRASKSGELSPEHLEQAIGSGAVKLADIIAFRKFIMRPKRWDELSGGPSNPDLKHFVLLANLALVLIDFYSWAEASPKWERYRVFYVSVLKQYNQLFISSGINRREKYLYHPGDLSEREDYFATYNYKPDSEIRFEGLRNNRMRHRLNRRAKNWFKRHERHIYEKKQLIINGVVTDKSGTKRPLDIAFNYHDAPQDLLPRLKQYRNHLDGS